MTIGGSGSCLVVAVCVSSSEGGGITGTWNGVSLTVGPTDIGTTPSSAILYLTAPATGNHTLSVSWASAADVYLGAESFTGTNAGGCVNAADNTTASNTTSITVTSTTTGATVANYCGNAGQPTINFTQLWEDQALGPGGAGSYTLGGTSNSHTFTGSGRRLPDCKEFMLFTRISVILLLVAPLFAVSHYVLPSPGQWTHAGTDWSRPSGFTGSCAPASMVRGDTYYVGGGSYTGGYTFSSADSSTTVITIQGATAANSSAVTGWSSSFDVTTTPAVFGNTLTFTTDYWVFDGTTGPLFSNTPSAYGFSFGTTLARGIIIGSAGSGGTCGSAVSNLTLAHFYGKATSSDTEKLFEEGNTYGGVLTNITFTNFLLDGWQGLFMTKSGNCSSTPYTGWIVQYGVMLNGFSSSANHGEWINPNERPISGLIVRYNIFRGYSGTSGMTGTIVANNSDNDNAVIYGNVFDNLLVGNGVITGTSAGNLNNAVIYNNTFLNLQPASGDALCGSSNGTGNIAYNNLFYNQSAQVGGGCTNDYNAYYSTTNTPSETHGQVASGNPFINSAAFNYGIVSNTSAGLSISGWTTNPSGCMVGVNCENIDPLGVTRGANGTIDRGALQIGNSQATAPSCTPGNGAYASTQTVTCTNPNSGTTVMCYSTSTTPATNGAGTGCTTGTAYTVALSITIPSTLKVIAGTSLLPDSTVSTYSYTVPTASVPSFSPSAPYSGAATNVSITCATGPTACYANTNTVATNGTTGCTSGTLYTAPIATNSTTTYYAVCGGTGYNDSAVTGPEVYTISASGPDVKSTGITFGNGITVTQ